MKSVGEAKTLKGKLKSLGDKDFKNIFTEAQKNGFKTEDLITIFKNTTNIFLIRMPDPGFKFTFVTTGITSVKIQSLL